MTTTEDQSPLQLCLALRAQGDLSGALAAAIEAAAAAPADPVPYYAQGELHAALGDNAGAVRAFAEALHRAPGWPDAWVNLGLARYRQGAITAAKTAMSEALRLAPGHEAAAANLGAFLRLTGEADAAEALLHETLARNPGAEGVRLNLAAALLQRQLGAEALALLDAAPALPSSLPALRQFHLARSLALLQRGDIAAARLALAALAAIGPAPPELAPLYHARDLLLAELERDKPRAYAAAQAMAAAIPQMGPNAVLEHCIMAHYDLAAFFSANRDPASAFTHWSQGHALLRKSQPFSRQAFSDFIQANFTQFDAARFAGPRAANRDPAPVFIVGMPRSGTTLCEQILAAHAQVHGAGERAALAKTAWELAGTGPDLPARLAALDAASLDAAAAHYLAELHALAPGKTRIIDKMPGNELYLGLVGLLLPGAKIIHCVRDPRDIGMSIWTFRFHGEHPYAHDLADLGWTIGQRARLMRHWQAVLPNPILTIALEDWVNDFDATLARVLTHLDLPPDPACARFYEIDRDVRTVSRAQVRRPVNANGIGRWRPYATQLAPLIQELEAAGMIEPAPSP
jgi:tetratricopeptide (TPR) repeat protein